MNIKIDIDGKKIANKVITDSVRVFANTTLYRLATPYTPFREGGLLTNVYINKDYIHYKSPYAKVAYKGKNMNFNKDKHPLATAYWDREAMKSKKQQLIDDTERFIERKRVIYG